MKGFYLFDYLFYSINESWGRGEKSTAEIYNKD